MTYYDNSDYETRKVKIRNDPVSTEDRIATIINLDDLGWTLKFEDGTKAFYAHGNNLIFEFLPDEKDDDN